MRVDEWMLVVLAVLIVLGWYLSYTAARLDRLHARVEGTYAVLDAALVRRAEATLEVANSGALDPASGLLLADSAESALTAGASAGEREMLESALSESLRLALAEPVVGQIRRSEDAGSDALERLAGAGDRVQLARRFHNDAVTQVRQVRRKHLVRWFRLAGHAELPRTVEFDDDLPAGLRG